VSFCNGSIIYGRWWNDDLATKFVYSRLPDGCAIAQADSVDYIEVFMGKPDAIAWCVTSVPGRWNAQHHYLKGLAC
ncbi:MAG: hypothetical protein VW276_11630, partial [Burkholderiaceae bacterium]